MKPPQGLPQYLVCLGYGVHEERPPEATLIDLLHGFAAYLVSRVTEFWRHSIQFTKYKRAAIKRAAE